MINSSVKEVAHMESLETQTTWIKDDLVDDMPTSALDVQIGGDHYKKYGDYQPWQVACAWLTPEELKGAAKFTAITYLCREADKGGREDIKKALHILELYLELTEPANAQT